MDKQKILTEQGAATLRTKIQDIVESHAKASMDVCWALYEVQTALVRVGGVPVHLWEAWGFKSWQECVSVELGMHITTAHQYKRVWEIFYVKLAGAWNPENLLSISKMRILAAGPLDRRNVNTWMRKAKKMTCAKLVAEVYGTEELHAFVATLTSSEMKTLNHVIGEARAAFGEQLARGELLVRMAREWHTMLQNTSKTRAKLRLAS